MARRTVLFAAALVAAVPVAAQAQQGACWLVYDGVDDQVRIAHSPAFPDFEYTITAWMKTSGASYAQAILTRGEDPTTDVMQWGLGVLSDGRVYLQIEDVPNFNSIAYPSTSTVDDGSWHHVAATRALNGDVRFYVDGLPDGSHANTLVTDPNSVQTMGMGFSFQDGGQPPPPKPPNNFFVGSLDEITLWTVALGPADVAAIHQSGLPANTTGLQTHWRLDEGSGQTAVDSVSGFDGTLGALTSPDAADPAWKCETQVPALGPRGLVALALALLVAGTCWSASSRARET